MPNRRLVILPGYFPAHFPTAHPLQQGVVTLKEVKVFLLVGKAHGCTIY
jgi:hypothetical protein